MVGKQLLISVHKWDNRQYWDPPPLPVSLRQNMSIFYFAQNPNTDIFLIFLVTFMSIVEGKFVAHKKNNNFDTVHSVSVKIKNVQKINDYGAYFKHC